MDLLEEKRKSSLEKRSRRFSRAISAEFAKLFTRKGQGKRKIEFSLGPIQNLISLIPMDEIFDKVFARWDEENRGNYGLVEEEALFVTFLGFGKIARGICNLFKG
jgi:hypothetical protein